METDIYDQIFQISDKEDIKKQFLGNKTSDLLVILPENSQHTELVEKILGAIHIKGLEEVQSLLLKEKDAISLFAFIQNSGIERIISFGFDGPRLGLQVDYQIYQLTKFKGREFIFTANLETLSASPEHKKALWTTLKAWLKA